MITLIKQIRTSPRAAANDFVTFVAADCDSAITVATYRQRLRGFIEFLEASEVSSVRAIQPGHVDDWVASLKRQTDRYAIGNSDRPPERGTLSKETIAGRLQAIKRFCAWCADRFELKRSPAAHLTVRRPRPRPADHAMQFDELLRLIDYARNQAQAIKSVDAIRYMALLAIFVESMARRGEVASMQISKMNLDNPQRVTVPRGDRLIEIEGYSATVVGKSGIRTIWFSDFAAAPLRDYLSIRPEPRHEPPHDHVWVAISDRSFGLPLTPAGIYQSHKGATQRLELKGPSGLHAIRHCMASYWAKHTTLDQLRAKLGHSSITTTMAYVATDARDVMATTAALSPLGYTDAELTAIL